MPDTICIVQEGQAADQRREALTAGLVRIGQESFGEGTADADVAFRVVKKDFGWTAGEPSTSSLVIRSVPPGLPLPEREAFMRKVCALFEELTGCSQDEIVVTAWDGPLPL